MIDEVLRKCVLAHIGYSVSGITVEMLKIQIKLNLCIYPNRLSHFLNPCFRHNGIKI